MLAILVNMLVPAAGIVAGVMLVDFVMKTARELRLGLFRPYRGESWPIGVQEDDDLHFDWRPASKRAAAHAADDEPDADRPGGPARHPASPRVAGAITIEDLPTGTVATQRPDRVSVHGARH